MLLVLELSAVLAIALAFSFLAARSTEYAANNDADVLMPLGHTKAETIQGVVISMGLDWACVSDGGETVELDFVNPSAKFQLGEVSVGDTVDIIYFDEGDSSSRRYHASSIEIRYEEPPGNYEGPAMQ